MRNANDWDEYFMGLAESAAGMSKDGTGVGALLVTHEGIPLLPTYNGPPKGVKDSPDRFERPRKYLFASHAEQNAIAFAARLGISTHGFSIYTTHFPCAACAKSIIQAGIRCVFAGAGTFQNMEPEVKAAEEMFTEAGVLMFDVDGNSVVAERVPERPEDEAAHDVPG